MKTISSSFAFGSLSHYIAASRSIPQHSNSNRALPLFDIPVASHAQTMLACHDFNVFQCLFDSPAVSISIDHDTARLSE